MAAKGYRPRINRNAVRQILGGAGQGILDSANQAEDDLSQKLAQTRVDDANNNPGPSTKWNGKRQRKRKKKKKKKKKKKSEKVERYF